MIHVGAFGICSTTQLTPIDIATQSRTLFGICQTNVKTLTYVT